jgi:hypothetical protein
MIVAPRRGGRAHGQGLSSDITRATRPRISVHDAARFHSWSVTDRGIVVLVRERDADTLALLWFGDR